MSKLQVKTVFLLAVALSCSQGAEETHPPLPALSAEAPTDPAMKGGLAFSSQSVVEEMDGDMDVPPEKFTSGAKAFAQMKDQLLDEYYAEGISEDDLYRAAAAGMLERMDPRMRKWNKLLSPQEMVEIKNDLKGEIVGIGAQIKFDPASGYVAVTGTITGSAAERAGLLPGDTIVRVNDKLYKGKRIRDVVADIRGKSGETVSLSVLREGAIIPVTITRERVAYDVTSHAVLPSGAGYLRIPSFNEKTQEAVKAALGDLATKKVNALVIDMRQNPGGLFEEAVHTAELFVPDGAPIVTLRKRKLAEEKIVSKGGTPLLADVPLVVLVDGATASGAEMVSEALRDDRHARLVGAHTMGKWSVQKIDDLPNGYAFKYTMSLLYAPNGKSYDGTGLVPDVEVTQDETQRARAQSAPTMEARIALDVQLRTAAELLRR